MIVVCTCNSLFQDQKYGPKRRVANVLKNKSKCRCTVCLALLSTGMAEGTLVAETKGKK